MPRRIANSTLNASTIDIMNVIRQNATYDYQQNVPVVEKATDIPRVGEVIYGTPAFANQFLNALVNRIAIVRMQSATFNNPYSILKKGYLEFGETVEDIFVSIAKAVDFSAEKASGREFKRTMPDVRSAFHVMNWRVMYPVTIQDMDLHQAFLSMDGVQNLIAKIVDAVYTGAEYDEFLLFKYLLIKAISHGKVATSSIVADADLKTSAVAFRGTSNLLPFVSSDYNSAGVKTNTPKNRQVIFMDANFNASFDVNVLASAFNMDKADFLGRLFIIDKWDTFDNERFDIIRANSDGLEAVTADELELMKKVKAVLLDENWFQVYDNMNKFTEKYVSSGLYWNYFYHTWKTISSSPFANAVAFVDSTAEVALPNTLTLYWDAKDETEKTITLTMHADAAGVTLAPNEVNFVQTDALTTAGIAVQKYGGMLVPDTNFETEMTIVANIGDQLYEATTTVTPTEVQTGGTLTLNKK